MADDGRVAVGKFRDLYFNSFGITFADFAGERKSRLPKLDRTSWLVLPYNLCLVKAGISRVVSSLGVDSLLGYRVGLSWSLGGKHLVHLLRFSGDSDEEGGKWVGGGRAVVANRKG